MFGLIYPHNCLSSPFNFAHVNTAKSPYLILKASLFHVTLAREMHIANSGWVLWQMTSMVCTCLFSDSCWEETSPPSCTTGSFSPLWIRRNWMFGLKVALHTPLIEYHNCARMKGNKRPITGNWCKKKQLSHFRDNKQDVPLQPFFLILLIVFY